jgi:hypothetical protein
MIIENEQCKQVENHVGAFRLKEAYTNTKKLKIN